MSEDISSTDPEPQNVESLDAVHYAQLPWECSKCNYSNTVAPINNSCPSCGHDEQTEEHQDPRLPYCPRCKHKQVVPDPKNCVNSNCGISLHRSSDSSRQRIVSDVPPGFPPGIDMKAVAALRAQMDILVQQAYARSNHDQQQLGPITRPQFAFTDAQPGIHPQVCPTTTNRMALPTPDGYQQHYPEPHPTVGHPSLSPPPTVPLLETHPNVLQSDAMPVTQLPADVKSSHQLASISYLKSIEDSQGDMDLSNQSAQSAVRKQTDPTNNPQASHAKEETQDHKNDNSQCDNTPISPPSENHPQATDENPKPKKRHSSEGTGAPPPADLDDSDNQSEKELPKKLVSPSAMKEKSSCVNAKMQASDAETSSKEKTNADDENAEPQAHPDKKEGTSKEQGTETQGSVLSTGAQSKQDQDENNNASSTQNAEPISNDNPTPVADKEPAADQPSPLGTKKECGINAGSPKSLSFAAAAAKTPKDRRGIDQVCFLQFLFYLIIIL